MYMRNFSLLLDECSTSHQCSEGFMITRMRRRVESLIQALDRAKPDAEKKFVQGKSFKKLSLKETSYT